MLWHHEGLYVVGYLLVCELIVRLKIDIWVYFDLLFGHYRQCLSHLLIQLLDLVIWLLCEMDTCRSFTLSKLGDRFWYTLWGLKRLRLIIIITLSWNFCDILADNIFEGSISIWTVILWFDRANVGSEWMDTDLQLFVSICKSSKIIDRVLDTHCFPL